MPRPTDMADRKTLIRALGRAWDQCQDRDLRKIVDICWTRWNLDSQRPPSMPLPERLTTGDTLQVAMGALSAYRPSSLRHQRALSLWMSNMPAIIRGRYRDSAYILGKALCHRLIARHEIALCRQIYQSFESLVSPIDQEAAAIRITIFGSGTSTPSNNVISFPRR